MRETLIVLNLQAKLAPSHIGASHLPSSEEEDEDSLELNSPSEIKNNNNNNDNKKTDHNQQCPFQKTKQTITEDIIFSHFHANFCSGRKLIHKGDVGKKMRFFFSRPKFRIQRVNYVVISIYYIDTDEIPGFFLLLKNHIFIVRSLKTLFLSLTCGYICVATVTNNNMISQLQESFPLRLLSIIVFISPL